MAATFITKRWYERRRPSVGAGFGPCAVAHRSAHSRVTARKQSEVRGGRTDRPEIRRYRGPGPAYDDSGRRRAGRRVRGRECGGGPGGRWPAGVAYHSPARRAARHVLRHRAVLRLPGTGRRHACTGLPDAGTPGDARRRCAVSVTWPLVVVGGGPAGIAAATEAARAGLRCLLIDEAPALGGQIYRQPPGEFRIPDARRLRRDHRRGAGPRAAAPPAGRRGAGRRRT